MRLRLLFALMIGTTPAAFGSNGFDIVAPSPPGVPIIINGIDASYAAMPLPPQWNPPHHIPLYSTPVIMAVEANHRAARFQRLTHVHARLRN